MDADLIKKIAEPISIALYAGVATSMLATIKTIMINEEFLRRAEKLKSNLNEIVMHPNQIPEQNTPVEEYLLAASSIHHNTRSYSKKDFRCLEHTLSTLQIYRLLARHNNREDLVMQSTYSDAYGFINDDTFEWAGHTYITYNSNNQIKHFESTTKTPLLHKDELKQFWERNQEQYALKFRPKLKRSKETSEDEYKIRIMSGGLGSLILASQRLLKNKS
jgi:hypothetical protein